MIKSSSQMNFLKRVNWALLVKITAAAVFVSHFITYASAETTHVAPQKGELSLYVVRQPLQSLFESLSLLAQVSIQVDPSVDRSVTAMYVTGTVTQIVTQLSKSQNLFFWYDGSRYIVLPASSVSRSFISVPSADDEDITKMIRSVAPDISANSIRFDTETRLLSVVGPVELRESLERGLAGLKQRQTDGVSVISFGIQK